MSYDLPPHPRTFPDQSEEWYRTREREYWRKVDEAIRKEVDSISTGGLLRAAEKVNRANNLPAQQADQIIRWCSKCRQASGPYPATDYRLIYCAVCYTALFRADLFPPVGL